jgi:MYXO-CTERM domain-containing protein
MNKLLNTTPTSCDGNRGWWRTAVVLAGLAISASSAVGASLISHWDMNNPSASPGAYANSVGGGPNLMWDSATKPHATFDPNETRLETSFSATKSTRLNAAAPGFNGGSLSFSMILDPTDMIGFGNILTKDTAFAGGGAWERLGWTVQHTTGGTVEFVVRGNSGGFFGATAVSGGASSFPSGGSFADPSDYFQIAGGYDSGSGNAFLYVTKIGNGYSGGVGSFAPIGSLTGGTASFGVGAVFDNNTLSVGTRQTALGYDGNGAGFDLYDLQIYDGLLTAGEVMALANNPGLTLSQVPEPSAFALLGLGALAGLRRRVSLRNT